VNRFFLFCFGMMIAMLANAQPSSRTVTTKPDISNEIPLLSEQGIEQEVWFIDQGQYQVRNVTRPTLTVYQPTKQKSKAAMIIAPGGAFLGLAIEKEGWKVAEYLNEHGVTAFVLKYRVTPTHPDQNTFIDQMIDAMQGKESPVKIPDDTPDFALQDGLAALRYVRENAVQYGIDPSKIGFMGFSAGGFLSRSVVSDGASDKPNFVAPIYPNMKSMIVPNDAPPMFVAIAADDFLLDMAPDFALLQSYRSAKRPIEFHMLTSGGHGFGLGSQNPATKDWPGLMIEWMRRLALFDE